MVVQLDIEGCGPPIGAHFLYARVMPGALVLGEFQKWAKIKGLPGLDIIAAMRDFIVLLVHLVATFIRLAKPGGLRSVVAESVLGHQNSVRLQNQQFWTISGAPSAGTM